MDSPLSFGERMVEDKAREQDGSKLPAGHDCRKEQRSKALNSVNNKQLTWHTAMELSKQPSKPR